MRGQQTSIFRAIWPPAVFTITLLMLGITMDYNTILVVLSVGLGLFFQLFHTLFLLGAKQGKTPLAAELYEKLKRDKEYWSLKINTWVSIILAVVAALISGAEPGVMFCSFCILYGIFRHIAYMDYYEGYLQNKNDFV